MKSTRLSGQNSSDLTKKRPPSGALPYIAREGFSGAPSRPRPLSRGKPYTRCRGKAVFCRRAAPGPPPGHTPPRRSRPAAPGTRRRAAARAPGRPAAPGKAPPCGPETPHVRPRRPRPGKRPSPGKRPTLARKRRRCRRPGAQRRVRRPTPRESPCRRKHSWPRPALPAAPRRCAAPPGRPPPGHTHPAGPREGRPVGPARGVYPQGGLNPWARPAGDRGPLSRRKSHNQTGD